MEKKYPNDLPVNVLLSAATILTKENNRRVGKKNCVTNELDTISNNIYCTRMYSNYCDHRRRSRIFPYRSKTIQDAQRLVFYFRLRHYFGHIENMREGKVCLSVEIFSIVACSNEKFWGTFAMDLFFLIIKKNCTKSILIVDL